MQDVVRDAGAPVSESGAGTSGYQIGNGTESPKQQAVYSGDHRPEDGGIHLMEHKDNQCKDVPDIQVADPPDTKTKDDSFQKDKNHDDREDLSLVGQGIQDNQGTDDFNVREKRQAKLPHEQDGAENSYCDDLDDFVGMIGMVCLHVSISILR